MAAENFVIMMRWVVAFLAIVLFLGAGPALISAASTTSVIGGAALAAAMTIVASFSINRTFDPIYRDVYDMIHDAFTY